ncbi:putative phage terminase, large subunit [Acetobacteraceae bacterium AT-5844]|nr:putative phage terminase, large subunit [Acetobacteraceae bacterium AT-5844]
MPTLPLWDAEARRAVAIFDRLRIPDVPGEPTFAEAGGEWFREIVAVLFGSLDPATKERMIRELLLLVPKKNAKTTNGAGLMLTALLVNRRPRAEFLLVAPTQKVSELAFKQVAGMIDLDPVLRTACHVQEHLKKITFKRTKATLEVKSFSPKVMTGVKPAGILVDELHVIAESEDADRVIGQLRGGMVSQPEAFLAFITTQSERPPKGVFKAELERARAIRDGKTSGRMLPILYEFPPAIALTQKVDDAEPYPWEDTRLWHMVMPNNGRSITVERLAEDYETAKLAGVEELLRWASQHLNIELGLALRSDRWAGADWWLRRADPALTLEELLRRSEVVTIGIDGGGLDDLLALAVCGRERGTKRWLLWVRAWAHPVVFERRKSIAPELRDFEKQGHLSAVKSVGEDLAELIKVVETVDQSGKLHKVGLDPMGVGAIVDAMAEIGVKADRVEGIPQGWQLTGAIKTAERKLADDTLSHGGQPILAWAVGNAKVTPAGNAVTITKQVSGSAKIDPILAVFDAIALMSRDPAPPQQKLTASQIFGGLA